VEKVVSGYAGGTLPNPTYEQVCAGITGHAEVIQIGFDPKKIAYEELLNIFWLTHDPTTPNRQGADSGTQYRSAVFYHSPQQKKTAEKVKTEISKSGLWSAPIITEITAHTEFYPAEDYHQNFYQENPRNPYCQMVIVPKLQLFRKKFKDKIISH